MESVLEYLHALRGYTPARYGLLILMVLMAGSTFAQLLPQYRQLCKREFQRWAKRRFANFCCIAFVWLWMVGVLDRGASIMASLFLR